MKLVTHNFRLDEEDYVKMKKVAKEENTTTSFLVRRAIAEFLKKYNETKTI